MAREPKAPKLDKDGNPIKRAPVGPRPAYLLYGIVDGEGNPVPGAKLVNHGVVRKAEDALSAIDKMRSAGVEVAYERFELK